MDLTPRKWLQQAVVNKIRSWITVLLKTVLQTEEQGLLFYCYWISSLNYLNLKSIAVYNYKERPLHNRGFFLSLTPSSPSVL